MDVQVIISDCHRLLSTSSDDNHETIIDRAAATKRCCR